MISPNVNPVSPESVTVPPAVDEAIGAIVQLGKLLADETRVRILTLLAENEEMCVRDLWEKLCQTQPGVSHHLALLREGGLVRSHQVGRNIYYRINRAGVAHLLDEIAVTPLGGQAIDSLIG